MVNFINLLIFKTMKKTTFIIAIFMLFATVGYAQQNQKKFNHNFQNSENSVLDFYRQLSSHTVPGTYASLYESLPDSLPELCNLIRSQFIHPYAQLPKYRDLIPKERWGEMFEYPTVESVLKGLLSYDANGLTKNRRPEDRLILGCWHNSILLASVLKNRGTPARIRTGHATYLMPDFHISHTICEVWNEQEKRWMLVDPSTNMIDFSRDKFDFSNELWLKFQKGEIDPQKYGIPGRYSGLASILGKLCTDLASLLGNEYPINQYAPILEKAFYQEVSLSADEIKMLNKISELMKTTDANNLRKLQEIYNNNPNIQTTKTFDMSKAQTNK